MKLLVENGADNDVRNKDGSTPRHLAVATSWPGAVQVAEFLLKNGVRVDSTDNYGRTPLYMSTNSSNIGVIKLLVRKEAYVNAADKNDQTSLHITAQRGRIDPAKILIEYGADIKARDTKKQ